MRPALEQLLRPHYRSLKGYVSAGMEVAKSPDRVFLNANENPFELPGLEGLNRYPDPQPIALAAAYGEAYGVEPEQVAMTRGADEAIAVLTKLFCEPGEDAVLISSPTFGMYGVNAKAMPARVVDVPLRRVDGTFNLDKDGIINAVIPAVSEANANSGDPVNDSSKAADTLDTSRSGQSPDSPLVDSGSISSPSLAAGMTGSIKLLYICSPNNPTGTSFDHEMISEICEAVEGHAVVVLDETYAEFAAAGSMTADLDSTPNLIILRTLSKSYAMAGMRMGSILCGDEDFIAFVKAKGLDAYPLPRLSIEAAFHVLSPEIRAIAMENIAKLLAERARMAEALPGVSKLIKMIYPSDANFLLIEMERAGEFIAYAGENNVIIRDFSGNEGTEGCIRLSIGTPEENDKVLGLLEGFC